MSFFKKHFKIIIVVVVILIALFIGFKIKAKNDSQKFNSKTETLINPEKKNLTEVITLAGSINAASKAELKFQTSGQLAWIGVKVGDKVKKYQSVASLNKDLLKKQLEIDFNNYKTTSSSFYDTNDQYKDSVITTEIKRILERSQNTLNNSVASYELGDLAIKYSNLFSPISGIVVAVDQPDSGINVTPANNIISVVDPQSIYFKSKIDQEDVVKIKVGDKAKIIIDSFPDKVFESKITYISFIPVIGESSTVYEVRFELPKENEDLLYRLGMDGDVDIILKEISNALTLPIEAISQEQDQNYVLTIDQNKKIIKKTVKIGIETDTEVEILEGITENDQIVIKK
ncbi:MAG: efflux RND transporter periplasmic adaptor subunit [Candidatus Shapirobacteria bacterium]|nr:efflux RND transporter periplasmic adaptor subunit [Candidatus Shapirobacteria bacterium]MDD4410367.1 efflux RND transporter periplasmic adaptor subunit [Candidatus Shapirobacteria bacterium]